MGIEDLQHVNFFEMAFEGDLSPSFFDFEYMKNDFFLHLSILLKKLLQQEKENARKFNLNVDSSVSLNLNSYSSLEMGWRCFGVLQSYFFISIPCAISFLFFFFCNFTFQSEWS